MRTSTTITLNVADLLGAVEGTKVYDLTTTYTAGAVLGVEATTTNIPMGTAIVNQLINTTNVVQAVTYNFRYRLHDPRNGGIAFCDHGVDTTITVYVNPTPRFTVTIADTIVCDSTTITLNVADLLGAVEGTKVYDLTTTYTAGAVLGVEATTTNIPMGTAIVDQLINTTNVVQAVTYNFRYRLNDPRNGGIAFCDHGVDTTITVYVNPTPRFTVTIADTIVCDSTTITLNVADLLGAVEGTKVYDLTTTYTAGAVLGVEATTTNIPMGTAIVDQLINTTNVVQAVTYNFRYRLNDPRNGGIAFCDHGVDTTITVYVNPTPRFTVTIADTIVCDSTTITLNVADLLGAVEGTKVYDLTTTYTAGAVLGVEATTTDIPMGTAIVNQLINTTNVVQAVTYNFRYRLNDPRNGGIAFCDHGVDTTITVYVNPTPRFTVTIADTIVCDSTTITLNVADLLGAVEGTKVYDLTTTYTAGAVLGVEATRRTYQWVQLSSDQLINTTNVVQAVTYNFRYRLNDPRNGGIAFCDHGVDTTITVYVNPTPRFTVTIADTIVCDSTTITLNVADLLGAVEGTKVYDLTTTYNGRQLYGSSHQTDSTQ